MIEFIFLRLIYLKNLERLERKRTRLMKEFYDLINKRKDNINYLIQTDSDFFFNGGLLQIELEKLQQISNNIKKEKEKKKKEENKKNHLTFQSQRNLDEEEEEKLEIFTKNKKEQKSQPRSQTGFSSLETPLLAIKQPQKITDSSSEDINSFTHDDCRLCRRPLVSTEPSMQLDIDGNEIHIPADCLVLPCCQSYVHSVCAKIALSVSPICDCDSNVRLSILLYLIKRAKTGRGVILQKKSEKIEMLTGDMDCPNFDDCLDVE